MRRALRPVVADASWINSSGTGRYATELISGLRRRYGASLKTISSRAPASPSAPLRLMRALHGINRGVFWTPQYMLPLHCAIPCVVTVHDLLQVRHGARHKRLYFERVLRPLYRRCARIITVSEFSRREISDWAHIPRERITVISNGVDPRFSPEARRYSNASPYLLYVGNQRRHKNLRRMLAGFAAASVPKDIRLVLSGSESEQLLRVMRRLRIEQRVHFAGHIDEAQLPGWYASALAVVNVSLYEGFGLPVLEGMASGCPVVAADRGALPEVGGEAPLLVDPMDIADIARGIETVVLDEGARRKCIEEGLARARTFCWDKSVTRLVEELETLARE